MAGIGFELRKIIQRGDILSVLKAYGYSAVISSGPWIISIVSIIVSGYVSYPYVRNKSDVVSFQVSVTYLLALSLIFTGFFQLYFSRFISDRLFEKNYPAVLPNIMGMLVVVLISGFFFISPAFFLFKDAGAFYSTVFVFSFLVLCGIWILNVVLTSLKQYKFIVFAFFSSYFFTVLSVFFLSYVGSGIGGLLLSFFAGQVLLFFQLLGLIIYSFPSNRLVSFDFVKKENVYFSLVFAGFFYNLGIWIDKFIFWFHPDTGEKVFSVLRNSILYDLPIFLAYLAIVPGMAVFLLRLETEFAQKYDSYYRAVREGGTLESILKKYSDMATTARISLLEVFRIQSVVVLVIFLLSDFIFNLFKFPVFYIPIFHIDLVGTGLQLFFMSILAIMYYLDKRKNALLLSLLFALLNGLFSFVSVELGIMFFGYGFALSLLVVSLIGLWMLSRDFERLNYETFMLQ
ncbi:exopolysaccharide Pel transporter PelG [Persephonella atlantica]|uniref:Exopolysaccharide Pel transporter PelG n=1 Tax=Persephonella atlantica TaxID=2699429 RepID=A0ABS1GHB8_9AQUI|nr:exopolysaccharide Pel transporter PelG [Persephonella atlantica]MBK3332333.1 exopolysaccharide Pel transporter PelG [Persephonella atlantica]